MNSFSLELDVTTGVLLTGEISGASAALFAVIWNLDDCVYEIPRSVTGIIWLSFQ